MLAHIWAIEDLSRSRTRAFRGSKQRCVNGERDVPVAIGGCGETP